MFFLLLIFLFPILVQSSTFEQLSKTCPLPPIYENGQRILTNAWYLKTKEYAFTFQFVNISQVSPFHIWFWSCPEFGGELDCSGCTFSMSAFSNMDNIISPNDLGTWTGSTGVCQDQVSAISKPLRACDDTCSTPAVGLYMDADFSFSAQQSTAATQCRHSVIKEVACALPAECAIHSNATLVNGTTLDEGIQLVNHALLQTYAEYAAGVYQILEITAMHWVIKAFAMERGNPYAQPLSFFYYTAEFSGQPYNSSHTQVILASLEPTSAAQYESALATLNVAFGHANCSGPSTMVVNSCLRGVFDYQTDLTFATNPIINNGSCVAYPTVEHTKCVFPNGRTSRISKFLHTTATVFICIIVIVLVIMVASLTTVVTDSEKQESAVELPLANPKSFSPMLNSKQAYPNNTRQRRRVLRQLRK